jgi:hypothetical protein
MPIQYDYKELINCKSRHEMDNFRATLKNNTFGTNNSKNCTICKNKPVFKVHKMRVRYGWCSSKLCNKDEECPFKYREITCLQDNCIYLSTLGEHSNHESVDKEKKHGIHQVIKPIIEEIIHRCNISRPKRVHIKLHDKEFEKIAKSIMPTLQQIENYIKYRRKLIRENSSTAELKEFSKAHHHSLVENDDQLFVFGDNSGDGSDTNHFQMGFTSKALLSHIKTAQVYHIDCTYKVIKYFYPLLVFGCTDIDGKFHPISFMITSHEETKDFSHFFESLNLIAKEIYDINFNPKYIVSDASRACFKSIKIMYPFCIILMCYFHVRLNVSYFYLNLKLSLIDLNLITSKMRKHKHLAPVDLYFLQFHQLRHPNEEVVRLIEHPHS